MALAGVAITFVHDGKELKVEPRTLEQPPPELPTPKDYATSRAALVTEIFKALLLINGGAAVALLTFLKDVKDPELVHAFVWAIILMSAGLVVAVFSAGMRFLHSVKVERKQLKEEPKQDQSANHRLLRLFYWSLMVISALLFLAGAGYMGWKYWQSSPHVTPAAPSTTGCRNPDALKQCVGTAFTRVAPTSRDLS